MRSHKGSTSIEPPNSIVTGKSVNLTYTHFYMYNRLCIVGSGLDDRPNDTIKQPIGLVVMIGIGALQIVYKAIRIVHRGSSWCRHFSETSKFVAPFVSLC